MENKNMDKQQINELISELKQINSNHYQRQNPRRTKSFLGQQRDFMELLPRHL